MSNKKMKNIFSSKERKKLYKHSNESKTNKKGFIIGVIAGVLSLITAATVVVSHLGRKKNTTKTTNTSISISDMGTELEVPKEVYSNFGETTGKIDKNKLVEKDGKIYADQESANKSDKVGTVITDTEGGVLKVEEDGTVKETEKGYEIVDEETETIIQSGEVNKDGSVDNYEKNEELGGTFEKEDNTDNLVRADADYYNEEGSCIIHKGDLLSKEALEYAKNNLSTVSTKVSSNATSSVTSSNTTSSVTSSNTSSTANQGVINKDGTYTIFGLTFESQSDYQQWVLQGFEGYAEVDGIMKSAEEIQKQTQKVK